MSKDPINPKKMLSLAKKTGSKKIKTMTGASVIKKAITDAKGKRSKNSKNKPKDQFVVHTDTVHTKYIKHGKTI